MRPDILFCYPSSLAVLIANVEKLDGLRIPLVFASSEVLHESTIAEARIRLGSDVIDFYGHAERIAAAFSVNGGEHHFVGAYGHIELLPCDSHRARIVATSIDPDGQIFVRYDTGDIAITGADDAKVLESIALGSMPFFGIEGRDGEYIELADGRRIIGLNHVPRGASGAASIQLHHTQPDLVDIYVVPGPNYSAATRQRILDNLYAKIPAHIRARIWLTPVPLRQANGKAPLLLRDLVTPSDRTLDYDCRRAEQAA